MINIGDRMRPLVDDNFVFNPDIHKVISKNIKKYRTLKGYTQLELSEMVELSHDFIRRIESEKGRNDFSLETLYKISVVLETPMDLFIKED